VGGSRRFEVDSERERHKVLGGPSWIPLTTRGELRRVDAHPQRGTHQLEHEQVISRGKDPGVEPGSFRIHLVLSRMLEPGPQNVRSN